MLNRFLKSTLLLPLLLQTSISSALESNKPLYFGNNDTKNAKDFSFKALHPSNIDSQLNHSTITISQGGILTSFKNDSLIIPKYDVANVFSSNQHSYFYNQSLTTQKNNYLIHHYSSMNGDNAKYSLSHSYSTPHSFAYHNNYNINIYFIIALYLLFSSIALFSYYVLSSSKRNKLWKNIEFFEKHIIETTIKSYQENSLILLSSFMRRKLFHSHTYSNILPYHHN